MKMNGKINKNKINKGVCKSIAVCGTLFIFNDME